MEHARDSVIGPPRANAWGCARMGARLAAAAVLAALAACSNPPPASPGFVTAPKPPEMDPAKVVLGTAPWTFEAREGRVIETRSYRIMITSRRQLLTDRLPVFMEFALNHYTSTLGSLPRPAEQMESYVMDNRPEWARMTQRVMGEEADLYLRIQRGGFSSNGRAILYDIGRRDTFAIAAHEGWHQYTQRTFRNPLPVTLEEGIATYMEGFRWREDNTGLPDFLPWANLERYDQLRQADRSGKLLRLDRLMRSTPQELMSQDPDLALTYYAQGWALIHFLNEGEGGRYQPALQQILADAAAGRLMSRVSQSVRGNSRGAMIRRNVDLLDVYTGRPAADLNDEYQSFLKQIIKQGTRPKITAGESPIAAVPSGA